MYRFSKQHLWVAAAILLLMGLAVISAMRSVSDGAGKLAGIQLRALDAARRAPTSNELDALERLVDFARNWDDDRPDWLAQQGRVLEWRAYQTSIAGDAETEADFRREAINRYREGVRARPLWPWAWLDLAYANYRAGDFGSEFQDAFARADVLAPWLEKAQLARVQLGVAAWSVLSARNRLGLAETISRLAANKPHGLIKLVFHDPAGRVLVCSFAPQASDPIERFCRR